jgi:hypothetical protein
MASHSLVVVLDRLLEARAGGSGCARIKILPPDPPDRPFERLLFLGDDQDGVPLEVLAVELLDDSLYVIHAMELRPRYNKRYKEAKPWRT